AAGGHDQRLAERMRVPGCACAGLERDTDREHTCRIGAWDSGSMRTVPVKFSSGPRREGCEPLRLISISRSFCLLLYVSTELIPHGGQDLIYKSRFTARFEALK